jgi:hypothetical protein
MGYDDQEVEEELEKIQKETEEAYKRDWSFLNLNEEDDEDLDNNEDNNDESTTE